MGTIDKSQVRELAARAGLRTATKPDSQDVCFIGSTVGRGGFLSRRMDLHPADVVDTHGATVGRVDAVELVTLGQRRGLGLGGGDKRYVVDVDVPSRRVTVGDEEHLLTAHMQVGMLSWPHPSDVQKVDGREVLVQASAHGARHGAVLRLQGDTATLQWLRPQRRVSPGQTVVFYDAADTVVLGGGIASA